MQCIINPTWRSDVFRYFVPSYESIILFFVWKFIDVDNGNIPTLCLLLKHYSCCYLLLGDITVTEYPSSLTHGKIISVAMCGQEMLIIKRSVVLISKTVISLCGHCLNLILD